MASQRADAALPTTVETSEDLMDRWARLKRGTAVVRDLTSSHDQVASDLLEGRGPFWRQY